MLLPKKCQNCFRIFGNKLYNLIMNCKTFDKLKLKSMKKHEVNIERSMSKHHKSQILN